MFETRCVFLPLFNPNLDFSQAVKIMKSRHHLLHDRTRGMGARVKNAVRMRVFSASGANLPLKLYAITKQTRFRPRNSKK